jgi:CYTH domain-containing protein
VIELDIFEGNLQGLIIAEVEFKNEKDAEEFVYPAWFRGAVDVTLDHRYKNQSLINGLL